MVVGPMRGICHLLGAVVLPSVRLVILQRWILMRHGKQSCGAQSCRQIRAPRKSLVIARSLVWTRILQWSITGMPAWGHNDKIAMNGEILRAPLRLHAIHAFGVELSKVEIAALSSSDTGGERETHGIDARYLSLY